MTENEAKEVVKKLRNKAELFKNSGFAVDGIVKSFEDSANAIEMLSEEIQQYRAIGTIDEFKALKDKNEPKKVADDLSFFKCPSCGSGEIEEFYETGGSNKHNYCPKCGQKIDWE